MSAEEKASLRCYRDYVVHILQPSYIKTFMTEYLSAECVERVLSEEGRSVTGAAERLLEELELLEEQGWFRAFKDTLLSAGYRGLSEALNEWDFKTLESTRAHRVLLDRVEPSLTAKIKASELLPRLSECLTPRQSEEIRKVEEGRGFIAGAVRLCEFLKRSDSPSWFKTFKQSLQDCECINALRLLDTDTESSESEEEEGDKSETMTTVSIHYTDGSEGEDDEEGAVTKRTNHITLSEAPPPDAAEAGGRGQRPADGEKRLRRYQTELAEPVYRGLNTIICAPTGCGKTVVALAISEHHLQDRGPGAKVVFMATKVEVYEQQYKLFQQHFQQKDPNVRITGLCGNQADQLSLEVIVQSYDIVVLTPQILVNALERAELPSLAAFSLLILDECHNTTGKHPYSVLMTSYLDAKRRGAGAGGAGGAGLLPQIVGLTASVGVGSFRDQAGAENNICQLCASLDARVISTVSTHTEELRSYVYTPEKDFFSVAKRERDPFIRIIHDIMAKIETLAKSVYDIDSLSNAGNRDYGSQKYEQWIVEVQKKCRVLQMKDEKEESRICRALFSYTEHLRKYNDALIINEDARAKDALDFLSAFMEQKKNAGSDHTEKQLTDFFEGQQVHLCALSSGGQCENPKLEQLHFILQEEYRYNDQTRTVLFVRTRALADALKKWIEETDSLKFLNPKVLIGRGRRSQLTGSGHMTLTSKKGVLEEFKSSSNQSQILICTSVADEGIDIPQCNLVLMYEYVGNVVKMVQVRGRGRAQGSKCFLISDKKERIDKERQNLHKEQLVERAVKSLQREPGDMLLKVEVFQREAQVRREQERRAPERPRSEVSFQLLCSKCKQHSCYSEDIRVLQNSHHVVLDRSLFSRASVQPHPRPRAFEGLTKTSKLFCGSTGCGLDWGIVASYHNIPDLPVVKVENFVVKNCVTGQQRYYRKWKEVPFAMATFDIAEIPDTWGLLPDDQSAA